MKKKLVFWRKTSSNLVEDNFSDKPEYHAFFAKCSKLFDFRIADNPDAYLGKGVFKNIFKYQNWKIIPAEKTFKPDIVYQRKTLTTEAFDRAVTIINTPEFKLWCPDKWNQYLLLGDYMPKTFLIQTRDDFKNNLKKITTKKAVVKPRRGEKGENIIVFDKNLPPVLDRDILTKKGYLLQEHADTNVEIPDVVNGIHDIKLITIGDKVFANLRTPEPSKTYCTFDSPYSEIKLNLLPDNILKLQQEVSKKINKKFPNNLYTIDIGMTKNGPIVFELNGHTAFPYLHFTYADDFFDAVVKKLLFLCK
jgi:hypothetical protein